MISTLWKTVLETEDIKFRKEKPGSRCEGEGYIYRNYSFSVNEELEYVCPDQLKTERDFSFIWQWEDYRDKAQYKYEILPISQVEAKLSCAG